MLWQGDFRRKCSTHPPLPPFAHTWRALHPDTARRLVMPVSGAWRSGRAQGSNAGHFWRAADSRVWVFIIGDSASAARVVTCCHSAPVSV